MSSLGNVGQNGASDENQWRENSEKIGNAEIRGWEERGPKKEEIGSYRIGDCRGETLRFWLYLS